MRELIAAFLHLRDSVVLRRSEYRLEKVTARRHLVAGLMTIHLDIDAAVAVIRGSDTVDDARQGLKERFGIDTEQADYVLALQLRRLTKLDVIELQAEAEKLDAEFAQLTELVSNPDARRKVIDQELVETAKLFKGAEFDRRTVLDFEATPTVSGSDEDGARERKTNPAWRLDDRGVFSDSHGDLLTSGLGWAVWTDGRVKFTNGNGLPFKIRDIPVARHHRTGPVGGPRTRIPSGVGDATRQGAADRSCRGESAGAAGNGVAGVKLAGDDDEVIAALPLTCQNGEALLSISGKAGRSPTSPTSRSRPGRRRRRLPSVRRRRGRAAGRGGVGDRIRARHEGSARGETRQSLHQGVRGRRDTGWLGAAAVSHDPAVQGTVIVKVTSQAHVTSSSAV